MKKSLIVLLVIALCAVFPAAAKAEEPQAKSKICEYKGTVKQKLENPNRISVESQGKLVEFYFTHDGKKECSSWQQLAIGDNVIVSCKEKKEGMEATCVKKVPAGTTFKGGTIQGGSIR